MNEIQKKIIEVEKEYESKYGGGWENANSKILLVKLQTLKECNEIYERDLSQQKTTKLGISVSQIKTSNALNSVHPNPMTNALADNQDESAATKVTLSSPDFMLKSDHEKFIKDLKKELNQLFKEFNSAELVTELKDVTDIIDELNNKEKA